MPRYHLLTPVDVGVPAHKASKRSPCGCQYSHLRRRQRGWTFTESCWAQLSQSRFNSLDLGLCTGAESTWEEIREACTAGGGRRPTLATTQFERELEAKIFTNGKEDQVLVSGLCGRVC
jgi:hypothetical protein